MPLAFYHCYAEKPESNRLKGNFYVLIQSIQHVYRRLIAHTDDTGSIFDRHTGLATLSRQKHIGPVEYKKDQDD